MTDYATPIPTDAIEHGEVFTRRWVVDLILDLCCYTPDRDLVALRAVEPACGMGAFLGPMVERLSASARLYGRQLSEAADSLRAFDLLPKNVELARHSVRDALLRDDWSDHDVTPLVEKWVAEGDYLLREPEEESVDLVVGNPPYIRLEDVPEDRNAKYREACRTMVGRADMYVGFIEVGLRSLKPEGILGFIVADRWMRNQYGRNLRALIARQFSVDVTIHMHDVDAFEEPVSAYPAVSIIRHGEQGSATVADTTRRFSATDAKSLFSWVKAADSDYEVNDRWTVARLHHWFSGGDLWPTGSPALLRIVKDLNERFWPLEDKATGTRIGIGVATGADAVFVTREVDVVEPQRLLPLSMARDTASGSLVASGHYLVNPWNSDGSLVDLAEWPRLAHYYEQHGYVLVKRNVARRNPAHWYRTIDKVDATLTAKPKLLFPDMKTTSHPVYDPGGLYPHHNLYYVISESWDLRVLGGLLLSRIAEAIVAAYCVKMRGGTLRFQAQYLRRIRVPRPEEIGPTDSLALADAFDRRDVYAATEAAMRVYGIDGDTRSWLRKVGPGV